MCYKYQQWENGPWCREAGHYQAGDTSMLFNVSTERFSRVEVVPASAVIFSCLRFSNDLPRAVAHQCHWGTTTSWLWWGIKLHTSQLAVHPGTWASSVTPSVLVFFRWQLRGLPSPPAEIQIQLQCFSTSPRKMSLLFRLRLPVRRRLEGTFLVAVIFQGASASSVRLVCCGRRKHVVFFVNTHLQFVHLSISNQI